MGVTKTLKKVPKVGTALVDTMRKTKSSIKQLFIPGMLFENMGLTYLGPVDGHNMRQMMKLFNEAKRVEGPGSCSCPDKERQRIRTCKCPSGQVSWNRSF